MSSPNNNKHLQNNLSPSRREKEPYQKGSRDDSYIRENRHMEQQQMDSSKKTQQILSVPKIKGLGEAYSPYRDQKEKVKIEVLKKYGAADKTPEPSPKNLDYQDHLHPTEQEKALYQHNLNQQKSQKEKEKTPENRKLAKSLFLKQNKVTTPENQRINLKNQNSNASTGSQNNTNNSKKIHHAKSFSQNVNNGYISQRSDLDDSFIDERPRRQYNPLKSSNITQSSQGGSPSGYLMKRRNSVESINSIQTSQSSITNKSSKRQQLYNRYMKRLKEKGKENQSQLQSQIQSLNTLSFQELYENIPSMQQLVRPKNSRTARGANAVQESSVKDYDEQWAQKVRQQSPPKPIECTREIFMKNLQSIGKFGQPRSFVDPDFPPNIKMLQNRKNKILERKYDFKRISDFYPNNYAAYLYKNMDPNFLSAGFIQNVNYLTAIAALSENPQNIYNILENQQISISGAYYGKINKNGVFKYYLVDDYFPIYKENDTTLASSFMEKNNETNEIYPQVIEKLLAKAYGNYQDLQKASVKELLKDLTGAPVTTIELNNLSKNIEDLSTDFQYNLLNKCTLVALQRPGNDPQFTKIPANLGMAILSVNKDETVTLRNPWGLTENKVPEGYNMENGTYKISWQQFQQFFDQVHICHTKHSESLYHTNATVRHNCGAYVIYAFEKKQQEGEFFLELAQRDQRSFCGTEDSQYEYAESRLFLFSGPKYSKRDPRKNELIFNQLEYVDGSYTPGEKLTTMKILNSDPGYYYIVAKLEFPKPTKFFDFNISYHGEEPIKFERIDYNENVNFLGQALSQYGKLSGIRYKETPQKIVEFLQLDQKMRVVIVGFENKGIPEQKLCPNTDAGLILKSRNKNVSVVNQIGVDPLKFEKKLGKEIAFVKDFGKLNKEELKLLTVPDFSLKKLEKSYFDSKDIDNALKSIHSLALRQQDINSIVFAIKNPDMPIDSRTLRFLGFR